MGKGRGGRGGQEGKRTILPVESVEQSSQGLVQSCWDMVGRLKTTHTLHEAFTTKSLSTLVSSYCSPEGKFLLRIVKFFMNML